MQQCPGKLIFAWEVLISLFSFVASSPSASMMATCKRTEACGGATCRFDVAEQQHLGCDVNPDVLQ